MSKGFSLDSSNIHTSKGSRIQLTVGPRNVGKWKRECVYVWITFQMAKFTKDIKKKIFPNSINFMGNFPNHIILN